jgi:hypothetical protein
MSIGAGIAIAGAWVFATVCAGSKSVSSAGMYLGIVLALVVTWWLK